MQHEYLPDADELAEMHHGRNMTLKEIASGLSDDIGVDVRPKTLSYILKKEGYNIREGGYSPRFLEEVSARIGGD